MRKFETNAIKEYLKNYRGVQVTFDEDIMRYAIIMRVRSLHCGLQMDFAVDGYKFTHEFDSTYAAHFVRDSMEKFKDAMVREPPRTKHYDDAMAIERLRKKFLGDEKFVKPTLQETKIENDNVGIF